MLEQQPFDHFDHFDHFDDGALLGIGQIDHGREVNYAQQVAINLGANVRAPNEFLFGWESGRYVFAGKNAPDNGHPDLNNLGQFILLTPGGP